MTDLKKIFHSFGINDLVNASSSGLLLFKKDQSSKNGEIRYVCTVDNTSARKFTGLGQLTGTSWESLFEPASIDQLPTLDQEAYFEATNTWCRTTNMPVDDTHFMCTLTDITASKSMKVRENHVMTILRDAEQIMQFGSWILDVDINTKEWSPGLYSILGYSPEQVADLIPSCELYEKHIHPDDLPTFQQSLAESTEKGIPLSVQYRIKTVDGQEKFVSSQGQFKLGENRETVSSIGSVFDLTSIKKIQNELERKVEELNRSNFDLEQFAYIASHDLQEPLRKIVSFGERLEKRSHGQLDEEMNLYLDRILNATRRMQDMISNLLEFSRFARSKEGFVRTDLNEILKSTLSDLEVSIQNKQATIVSTELPELEVIPVQMSQLFNNLLSNSLKFTLEEEGPHIDIKSEKLSHTDQIHYGLPSKYEYVRITFTDNGIGFENNDSNRIFTLFQRLRGRSEYEGAGIGLSVCKKVVENHSGIILASGLPNVGATFTIILPLSQS